MASPTPSLETLRNVATMLRLDSVRSTSEAGSGHPTSCLSAADIVATLFFAEMRFDPRDPQNPDADRFILSKGHAAPVLYAAWAEAGAFDRSELMKLREIGSDLEGHPTPRLPFVDVATGSLGQGICATVGCALNARRIGSNYRTYVLLGDGENAEGSVWEAAEAGAFHRLDNLCGIVDVNRLGQSRATQWGHDLEAYATRWGAFGWHPIIVDGHDLEALLRAYDEARRTKDRPTMIVAKTLKGKGVSFIEDKDGWHGKPLKKGEELDRAVAELERQLVPGAPPPVIQKPEGPKREVSRTEHPQTPALEPAYKRGDVVATRLAPRSPRSAPTHASSRSTPTSRIRRSATGSKRCTPSASIRCSSPSRSWSAPRWGSPPGARFPFPPRSPAF
jgi:transketolase